MKDVAKRAAELSPKPWEHDMIRGITFMHEIKCTKCGITQSKHDTDCTIPDPIDITKLGPALECFRGLTENEKFEPTLDMARPFQTNGEYPPISVDKIFLMAKEWILEKATAEQIWEICVLAKESE